MRTPTSASIFYAPTDPPDDPARMGAYIKDELLKIGATLEALARGHVDMAYVAPTKPRDGDIRLADGTSWNPGAGRGIYAYFNNVWNKL